MKKRNNPAKRGRKLGRLDEEVMPIAWVNEPPTSQSHEPVLASPAAKSSISDELEPLPMTTSRSSTPKNPLSKGLSRLMGPSRKSEPPPTLQTLQIPIHLSGSPNQWASSLTDLGFTSARAGRGRLEIEWAESLDLQGKPHQFIKIEMSPSGACLHYTKSQSQHPARRKLQALQLLLLTLSVSRAISGQSPLNQLIAESLASALELTDEQTDALRLKSESLGKQVGEQAARLSQAEAQREADARRQVADAQSLQTMQERLAKLETLPDSALEEELMEWLRAHDGSISVGDFSRHLGVTHARVSDLLDRLCKAGRIQRANQ